MAVQLKLCTAPSPRPDRKPAIRADGRHGAVPVTIGGFVINGTGGCTYGSSHGATSGIVGVITIGGGSGIGTVVGAGTSVMVTAGGASVTVTGAGATGVIVTGGNGSGVVVTVTGGPVTTCGTGMGAGTEVATGADVAAGEGTTGSPGMGYGAYAG